MDTPLFDEIARQREVRRLRDEAIFNACENGQSCAKIAKAFGLSRSNVAVRIKLWKRKTEQVISNDPFDNLSRRTATLLRLHGLTTAKQIQDLHPHGLLDIPNLGYKSLREIEDNFLPGHHYEPWAARSPKK